MPRYLRRKAVCARYNFANSTLYVWIKQGLFPAPVKLGPRMVAWSIEELEEWERTRKR